MAVVVQKMVRAKLAGLDDLEQLISVLQENEYKPMGPISPNPRIRFYFVKDPDGYTVQLVKQE